MYTPPTGCTTLLHLLIKRPIIIILLGLLGTVAFVKPKADYPNIESLINKKANQIIKEHNIPKNVELKLTHSYENLLKAKIQTKNKTKRYGPARLTKQMARHVAKVLDCESEYYQELLRKPKLNKMAGFVYFLQLVNHFRNLKFAKYAYQIGYLLPSE